MIAYIIVLVMAYLLGSISFSVIISKKMAGFDVREKGSGNAGTTNVLRSVGKKAAVITLIFDVLKGVLAVLVAYIAGNIVKEGVDKANKNNPTQPVGSNPTTPTNGNGNGEKPEETPAPEGAAA